MTADALRKTSPPRNNSRSAGKEKSNTMHDRLGVIDNETKVSLGLLGLIIMLVLGAYGMVVAAESRLSAQAQQIESRVFVNEAALRDMRETLRTLDAELREMNRLTGEAAKRNAQLKGSIDVLNERLKNISS